MRQFLILLLIPFLFAGTFQSYTEKTTPEASDILLILDNDDLTTKKVQVGNIGDGINWYTTNINSDGINWTSLDQDIQKGGMNWTSLEDSIQKGGVNWSSLNDSIQASGFNWDSLNQDIQQGGINWTSANMYVSGANGNIGIGTINPNAILKIGSDRVVSGTIDTSLALGLDFSDTPATNLKFKLYPGGGSNNWGLGISSGRMDYVIGGSTTNTHSFYFNTTQLMDVRGTGNVGIGTFGINTTARLAVQGAGTTTGKNFETRNSSGTALVTMLDSGNVGLGSTIPNGAFVVRTSANDIGWSKQSAANQACNTTCTASCVFGQNTADFSIVDCADANADVCICAGSN